MRIETPKERIERKCRSAVYLAEAHERVMAEARRQEDGFIKICDQNHREAMERDTRATVTAAVPEPQQLGNSEQLDGGAEYGDFMPGLCNGILLGIVIALIVVWVIARVRGGAA